MADSKRSAENRIAEGVKILTTCEKYAMELDKKRYLKIREEAEKSVEAL